MKKFAFALCLAASAVSADAVPISGLFNTGTNSSGLALSGGAGVADPHYLITSSTSGSQWAGATPVTYYNGAYVPEDADSRWISMSSTGGPGLNTTIYSLSFNLGGLDPATALINGSFGADNYGAISLNGISTGVVSLGFNSLTNFTITSGFVAGLNTLSFAVTDYGPPAALRVDNLAGTANAIPEPAMLGLFGLGLVGLTIARRKPASVRR